MSRETTCVDLPEQEMRVVLIAYDDSCGSRFVFEKEDVDALGEPAWRHVLTMDLASTAEEFVASSHFLAMGTPQMGARVVADCLYAVTERLIAMHEKKVTDG